MSARIVCIGGPSDGHRVPDCGREYFVHQPYRMGDHVWSETGLRKVRYLREHLQEADGTEHFVYVFDGVTNPVARLIDGYRGLA